ncbi:TetR/AcrR family transcriptional regulator [Solirubrobacter phytolaccae]|uniref:TetR/AcrR family transcriptional regulator n=1 Tax=Solirubrobacter phytolaccae TaxID=1404360 RepID=A0A9X3NC86_9ACTN|nr:TetR/AcrR family transcriptional regulator [Solirubrobacter phytolaccae]MDA0182107.1 TetR/AcrR family transcriptional regulator [Solirubrobacter phytolaccae]
MAVKRTRRPRGSLTPDVILEAAEAVAEQGFEALSMRAVAARLEAVPMALYNHFATKEQLVAALLDRVLFRFEPPPATDDWIEDLRAFANAHRRLLAAHAWAVAPIFTNPSPGLASVRIGELALAILVRGGLSNADAVAAFSGMLALNYGWASFTAARDLDPGGPSHDVAAMLRALPAEAFPLTVATADAWGTYGSDRDYAFALGRFLDGLRAAASDATI